MNPPARLRLDLVCRHCRRTTPNCTDWRIAGAGHRHGFGLATILAVPVLSPGLASPMLVLISSAAASDPKFGCRPMAGTVHAPRPGRGSPGLFFAGSSSRRRHRVGRLVLFRIDWAAAVSSHSLLYRRSRHLPCMSLAGANCGETRHDSPVLTTRRASTIARRTRRQSTQIKVQTIEQEDL